MSQNVTIQGVRMDIEAARCVEMAGVDVAQDVADLRTGRVTREALLNRCLNGADDAHEGDWREYVASVVVAANA